MTASESRFLARLVAYVIANVVFYFIQQRFGWVVAFCIAGFAGTARALARADFQKALEERDGLSK